MIKTIESFIATCDNCNEDFESVEGFGTFPEKSDLESHILSAGWIISNDRLHCSKCLQKGYTESKLFITTNPDKKTD